MSSYMYTILLLWNWKWVHLVLSFFSFNFIGSEKKVYNCNVILRASYLGRLIPIVRRLIIHNHYTYSIVTFNHMMMKNIPWSWSTARWNNSNDVIIKLNLYLYCVCSVALLGRGSIYSVDTKNSPTRAPCQFDDRVCF